MGFLHKIVKKLLFNSDNICCLCLICIENGEIAINMQDEVVLKENNSTEMSALLMDILGEEILENTLFHVICEECAKTAIKYYTFRNKCKENSKALSNIANQLSDCFNDTLLNTTDIKQYKALYATIDSKDHSCHQYYGENQVSTKHEALRQLNTLTELRKEVGNLRIEIKPYDDYEDLNYNPKSTLINCNPKTGIKKPKASNKIPTSDMLYDSNDKKNYKCKICLKVYPTSYNLRQHFIRMHAPKKFKCSECSREYGSLQILEQHKYDSHSKLICSECGKSYANRQTLKIHELRHKVRFTCPMCEKVYKRQETLNKHVQSNLCSQPRRRKLLEATFICDVCNKKFSHKSTLRVHIQFEHGNAKAHICSWCNKKFHAQSKLKAHIVKHTREKNFSCKLCSDKFVTKESLVYHTRIHTGERPYECDHCNSLFISASRRADHIKRHHAAIVECDICQTKFTSSKTLDKHRKRHFNPTSRLHYTKLVEDQLI